MDGLHENIMVEMRERCRLLLTQWGEATMQGRIAIVNSQNLRRKGMERETLYALDIEMQRIVEKDEEKHLSRHFHTYFFAENSRFETSFCGGLRIRK